MIYTPATTQQREAESPGKLWSLVEKLLEMNPHIQLDPLLLLLLIKKKVEVDKKLSQISGRGQFTLSMHRRTKHPLAWANYNPVKILRKALLREAAI